MDSKFYRHVFGGLPKKHTVSHYCIPCYNLLDPSILKDLSKSFDLENGTRNVSSHSDIFPFFRNFSYETDFSTVLYPGSGLVDRASKLVLDKLSWDRKLAGLTPKDCNIAMDSLKLGKKNVVSEINFTLEKYLKHFKNDPEPDFKGDYNWLYTGGNIAGIDFGSSYYLIAADEIGNSTVLNFTKVDPDFKVLNAEDREQGVFFLQENDPVLQISCTNEVDNLLFLTRQKRKITLGRMNNNRAQDYWSRDIDDGIFICLDLSSQSRTFVTLDSFLEKNLFDVETGKQTPLQRGKVRSSSWAQIVYNCDGTGLYFADQHSCSAVDLRVASNTSLLYGPTTAAGNCELICNVITRKYSDNTLLIATNHNLLEVDIRNKKVNQRWTHMMTSPPQFGKTSCRNGEELIVLQSENPDEMVGIMSERDYPDSHFVSKSNPCILENIKRTWNKAQLNGMCSHPGIRERVDFAVTGLEMLEIFADSNDGPHILTINSGGDVTLHKLKRKRDEGCENHGEEYRDISEQSVKGLKGLDDHCLKIYSEEMTADEWVDLSPLIKVLEEENLEGKNFRRQKAYWPRAEMFSAESLSYFKDFMAERILQVWGVEMKNLFNEDENEEKDEDDEDRNFQEQFGVTKVIQWMETNENQ